MSLSFKIQKPSNAHSQQSTQNQKLNKHQFQPKALDSSDDETSDNHFNDPNKRPIEFISHFDSTRRPNNAEEDKRSKQILIPALPNRDFRAIHMASKQKRAKRELYKPDQVNSMGKPSNDTSNKINDLEGLDKMNSKQIEGGLKARVVTVAVKQDEDSPLENPIPTVNVTSTTALPKLVPQTIEEQAVKELLSQANHSTSKEPIDIQPIHMPTENHVDINGDEDSSDSGDETAQFRKDVSKRPDCSTLDDYERIPVGQFGLALLKGMGWKEGTAATKKGRVGLVEAYVPQARPSLLGIGAKPLATLELDSTNKKTNHIKPDKKYVPLLRKVIDNGGKTTQRMRSPSSNHDSASPVPSSRSQSSYNSPSGLGQHDAHRSSHHDSRKYESSRHRDSRDGREDRSRREYSNNDRSSQHRYEEERPKYGESRDYGSSSRQKDPHSDRDHKSRRDYSDDDRPSSHTPLHRSSSHSHSHRNHSSSSIPNKHHESSRNHSKYN